MLLYCFIIIRKFVKFFQIDYGDIKYFIYFQLIFFLLSFFVKTYIKKIFKLFFLVIMSGNIEVYSNNG